MNYDLLLPLLVTVVLATTGWFAVHRLTANRERASKQRDVRVSYLIQAYRDIGAATLRQPNSEQFVKLEYALHDIQLFGSASQIAKLQAAASQWEASGGADHLKSLLADLREDLRRELELPATEAQIIFFRAQKWASA